MGELDNNQQVQDPNQDILNGSQSQEQPGTGQGAGGLSEADVQRIAREAAKSMAQSEAYKAENRITQNVQGQVDQIKIIMQSLARQNPSLKLESLSDDQIRAAQREMVINQIADQMLQGKMPQTQATTMKQNHGESQGESGLTVNDTAYLRLRAEEIFAEEGVELYNDDPEVANLDTTNRGKYLVSLREAVKKKMARVQSEPGARINNLGSGAGGGSLKDQYIKEKMKLQRGPSYAKTLVDLKMRYQRMGAKPEDLN